MMNYQNLILLFLVSLLYLCNTVTSTQYYLESGAATSNCGDNATPCAGLLYLPTLQDGDIISVAPGQYPAYDNFPYTISAQNISIIGAPTYPVFNANSTQDNCLNIIIQNTFQNNTIFITNIQFSGYSVNGTFGGDTPSMISIVSGPQGDFTFPPPDNSTNSSHLFHSWHATTQQVKFDNCIFTQNYNYVPYIVNNITDTLIIPSSNAYLISMDQLDHSASVSILNSIFSNSNISSISSVDSALNITGNQFISVGGLSPAQVIFASVSTNGGSHVHIQNNNFDSIGYDVGEVNTTYVSVPQSPALLFSGTNCYTRHNDNSVHCTQFEMVSNTLSSVPFIYLQAIGLQNGATLAVNSTTFNSTFQAIYAYDTAVIKVAGGVFLGQANIVGVFTVGSYIIQTEFSADEYNYPVISFYYGTSMVIDQCTVNWPQGSSYFFLNVYSNTYAASSIEVTNSNINTPSNFLFIDSVNNAPAFISFINNTFNFTSSQLNNFYVIGPVVVAFSSNLFLLDDGTDSSDLISCGSSDGDGESAVVLFVGNENINYPPKDNSDSCFYACNEQNQDICPNGASLTASNGAGGSDVAVYVLSALLAVAILYAILITAIAIVIAYLYKKGSDKYHEIQ